MPQRVLIHWAWNHMLETAVGAVRNMVVLLLWDMKCIKVPELELYGRPVVMKAVIEKLSHFKKYAVGSIMAIVSLLGWYLDLMVQIAKQKTMKPILANSHSNPTDGYQLLSLGISGWSGQKTVLHSHFVLLV